ncbi:HAD-like domain-containing protein [Catenaria anguillulae PL171]|uniref:HAD-like domain-containing protein n=1 Tax=Catenaria anguillulae PL171 TaxID=765915 RepID=A0A1Y2I0U3_9FUNG|nr:HAD-like domain-containing protein [Catenaria anguillulae PL171]
MAILKSPQANIKATSCLFDMDGLLLNTEDVYTQVSTAIASRYGKTYDWALKAKLMGMREDAAALLFIQETGVPMTAAEYLAERNRMHEELFPQCTPLPGVLRLVTHLRNVGMPMRVCTSSHRKPFLLKSQNNQHLFKLFDGHITTGDDPSIKHGKPAPDLFLVGHEELGRPKDEVPTAVVFEDAISGVQAGLNAGMNVVWVRDPRMHREVELEAKCFAVIESMEEFDPAWIGVTAFPSNAGSA